MKTCDIRIGGEYLCKVNSKPTTVKITGVGPNGVGWTSINVATGHAVRIRSPQRLRGPAKTPDTHFDHSQVERIIGNHYHDQESRKTADGTSGPQSVSKLFRF